MSNFWSKYKRTFVYALSAVVCTCFFVYFCTLLGEYASGVNRQAVERAEFYTQEQTRCVIEKFESVEKETEYIAAKASAKDSAEGFVQELKDVRAILSNDALLGIYYTKDGELYGENDALNGLYPDFFTSGLVGTAVSKVFQYENRAAAVAVSAKASGEFADSVIAVYAQTAIVFPTEGGAREYFKKSAFTLLCKYDGRIIDRVVNSEVFTVGNEPVQDGIVKEIIDDSETLNKVNKALLSEGMESFIFKNGSDEYVLSVGSFGASRGNASLVCAYRVADIYGEGFAVMQNISAALACLGVVIMAMLVLILVAGIKTRRKIVRQETVVPCLNCATLKKFAKNAEDVMKRHANSNFAFVSLQINNFGYVAEHFGDEAVKKVSLYVANAIRRALVVEETFGYAYNGEFLLLLHCRGRQAFSERLNGLYLRLAAFNELENYKVGVTFAVYENEKGQRDTVKQTFDKLNMAKDNASSQNALFSIVFYDESMRQNYMKKAEIEGRMDRALKNSEFHLFYQPKYNLKKKNLDGCEILVRWYDPEIEKYHLPSEFLPVFEENGFIVKLDRFVFYKACENIAKRVESRQICYPVSVNVSRVTAIQTDFVDYYVRIKNKFNIKDGFITLEFTESFAYENYEFLKDITDGLHANGFLCSIDDFGTGYSSYNILKTIEIDEIKLDKFFLSKGFSSERDQTLLESVIGMVKKLGMKVTQEGVELREDLYRLESLGCDVIQGYYFAKPMKYSDYCEFIDKNFI